MISYDLVSFWFKIDDTRRIAYFQHSSLQEFLNSKFYSFSTSPNCYHILHYISHNVIIRNEILAAFSLADGDVRKAIKLISSFALTLKTVTNLSSLELSENNYQHLATLLIIIIQSKRLKTTLLFRCVVARVYINTHHRSYALGFIDNLRITSLIDSLNNFKGKGLIVAAVKQLMAHALINSGDTKTALALMHEVENFLNSEDTNNISRAIEFDMCDRLQAYYCQQSAYNSAEMFFFRARKCAHVLSDFALLNLSFSAEFHLKRYLDSENAMILAERQLKHAQKYAPTRTVYHAKVNYLVAQWSVSDCGVGYKEKLELERLERRCRSLGFGHLIPRLDYLLVVISFLDWRKGLCKEEDLKKLIEKGNESSRQYGYSDYIWLLESINLLRLIENNSSSNLIINQAANIIDYLFNLDMTFVAGEELCFQNTVVLSNSLQALYNFSDQQTAWEYANKISFSPIFIPKPKDQIKRLESVFSGQILNRVYDPRALISNSDNYSIILV